MSQCCCGTPRTDFFCSSGFRPVTADDERAAAETFASRQARREYGKSGYVYLLRLDSWSENGSCTTYDAFIGHKAQGENATVGHNISITVIRR